MQQLPSRSNDPCLYPPHSHLAECCHYHRSHVAQLHAGGKLKLCADALTMPLYCCCHCLLYCSTANVTVIAACCLFIPIAIGWLLLRFIDFLVFCCYRHTLANAASTALVAATFASCTAILLIPLLPLLSLASSSVDCSFSKFIISLLLQSLRHCQCCSNCSRCCHHPFATCYTMVLPTPLLLLIVFAIAIVLAVSWLLHLL